MTEKEIIEIRMVQIMRTMRSLADELFKLNRIDVFSVEDFLTITKVLDDGITREFLREKILEKAYRTITHLPVPITPPLASFLHCNIHAIFFGIKIAERCNIHDMSKLYTLFKIYTNPPTFN